MQLAALILWATPTAARTRASLAAAALTLISSLGSIVLSYTEHGRAARPSSLLGTYIFTTLIFDIAHARTLLLRSVDNTNYAIACLAIAALVSKAVVLVLEALEKHRLLLPEYWSWPPEATASIYNRFFFWWLNPLFRDGFSRVLEIDDLFQLDKQLSASHCYENFVTTWNAGESCCAFPHFSLMTCFPTDQLY